MRLKSYNAQLLVVVVLFGHLPVLQGWPGDILKCHHAHGVALGGPRKDQEGEQGVSSPLLSPCRTEIFSGKTVTHEDIKYEQACILYNLGEGQKRGCAPGEGIKYSVLGVCCQFGASLC